VIALFYSLPFPDNAIYNWNMNDYGVSGLEQGLLEEIIEIVLRRKKAEKIVIFGSRATGDNSMTSDIDIAIFGKEWSDTDISVVKDELEENVRTPLKFDVLDFYRLTKEPLAKNIKEKGKVIYDSGKD
jgi:predicted nucleotidyltransferase